MKNRFGKVQVPQHLELADECWNACPAEVVPTQVKVLQVLKMKQRWRYFTAQGAIIIWRIKEDVTCSLVVWNPVPEVQSYDVASCVVTVNTLPGTAISSYPRRELVVWIVDVLLEINKGHSFTLYAISRMFSNGNKSCCIAEIKFITALQSK